MGQTYKADFEVDNGTDFDKYNFSTTADQVAYTKNGKETNVQAELDALNTGIAKTGVLKPTVSGVVDVPSGTTVAITNVCTIWLPPGVYLIEGTAKFSLPNKARIDVYIRSVDGEHTIGSIMLNLPEGSQWIKNTGILKVEETSKQIVLAVRQSCGSTISCTGNMVVTQIA